MVTDLRPSPFDPATYRSPLEGDPRLVVKPLGGGLRMVAMRGGVAVVIADPDPRWTPRQRGTYLARRDASLLLSCPACGNDAVVIPPKATLLHETDCVAGDDRFLEVMAGQ